MRDDSPWVKHRNKEKYTEEGRRDSLYPHQPSPKPAQVGETPSRRAGESERSERPAPPGTWASPPSTRQVPRPSGLPEGAHEAGPHPGTIRLPRHQAPRKLLQTQASPLRPQLPRPQAAPTARGPREPSPRPASAPADSRSLPRLRRL